MISVVVPIYNMKSFLPRCIDSLLNQTFKNFEIILVDDGSTDGSSALCDEYTKQNYDLIRCIHKQNGGLSSARNAGMAAAMGNCVIFPDPDDWVEPNYLSCLWSHHTLFQADMVCTGYFIDYDDRRIPVNSGQTQVLLSGKDAQAALLIPPSIGGFAWNKLYRLDIIRDNRLLFLDDVGTTEDLDFAYRYLQFCDTVCFDPSVRTYHYYQRSGAATRSGFSNKKIQAIHTYEKILVSAGDESVIGRAAKEEICNAAINLLPLYLKLNVRDASMYQVIQGYIKQYYADYLGSARYGFSRKAQAIAARYVPKLYGYIKNKVTRK